MQSTSRPSWVSTLLGEHDTSVLAWWYRHTAPREPQEASVKEQDLARRSKIMSALGLFLLITLFFVTVAAFQASNPQILTTMAVLFPTLLICLLLNRFRQVTLAGIIFTISLVGGMYLTLFSTAFLHGGLTPAEEDIFFLTMFGEITTALLLPPFTIFVMAAINVSLTLFLLFVAPHTGAFALMLSTDTSISFRLMEMHLFSALALWVGAHWTRLAVQRANRATEVVRLHTALAEASQEKVQAAQRLSHGIAEIVRVHTAIANNHLDTRVGAIGEQTLLPIAGPLNRLLDRYQRARQDAQERDLYRETLNRVEQEHPDLQPKVARYLQEARARRAPTREPLRPRP